MPYLGRKQVELWNHWEWWTLPQAVTYVVKLDHVEPEEARRQIHLALIDGNLELQWGAFGPPPHLSMMPQEPARESPPLGGPLWETADIEWEAGTVLDNFDPQHGRNERRVLLIWRKRLVAVFDPKAMISKAPPPVEPVRGNNARAVYESEPTPEAVANQDLRGKALLAALDSWVERRFEAKLQSTDNLPDRDNLLKLARREVSINVTDQNIRKLRSKYASAAAKKGGARLHKHQNPSSSWES